MEDIFLTNMCIFSVLFNYILQPIIFVPWFGSLDTDLLHFDNVCLFIKPYGVLSEDLVTSVCHHMG